MTLERISKLQEFLDRNDAAIITSDANRFYFTGFPSSAGAVLVTKERAYFLIDFRYYEKAKRVVKSCEVLLCDRFFQQAVKLLENHDVKNLLLESGAVSVSEFNSYQYHFTGFHVSASDDLDEFITELRSVKSEAEVNQIKQAQKLTDDTFSYIIGRIDKGMTEREIMLDMEFYMRRAGSEGVSFDFIVVSGKNTSLPHGVPTDKKIENGDFITMDFGAVVGGYRSDMTRTVAFGSVSQEQKEVYNIVLKAQQASLDLIKSGVRCRDVDKAARDVITDAGYGRCFGHALGHSVGIQIHEKPSCNMSCKTLMKPGLIMTVEPGIYIENKFGVRIEDMVVVTKDGCDNLTHSRKDLIVL